jgi:hypothetical protein
LGSVRKLVELSTNVAILLVCALLCWSYLMRGSVKFGASAAGEAHLKGVTLPTLPNYRWGNHTESLVLALRIGCHYCEASMPFYKRLDELAKSNKLSPHMLVVMPDNQELGTRLLQSNGLKVEAVFSQPLNSIDIT